MNKKLFILALIVMTTLVLTPALAADYDFDGETVVFGGYWGMSRFENDDQFQEHLQQIEKDFNVNIQFSQLVTTEIRETFISSIMSGDPIVDVLEMPRRHIIDTFYPMNIIYPLDGILDDDYFNSLPKSQQEVAREYMKINDNYFMFSANGGLDEDVRVLGSPLFLVWNKELFERENLPSLYEIYEEGKWTYDKMLEIAEAATNDLTGDGDYDQWGITNIWPHMALPVLQGWFLTNNAPFATQVDGRVEYALDSQEAIETLEFLHELNQFRSTAGNFYEGRVAMMVIPGSALTAVNTNMPYDYGLMYLPRGSNLETNVVSSTMVNFVLPITTTNPAAKIELTNALFQLTDKYRDMENYEEEMIWNKAMNLRDEESLSILEDMTNNFGVVNEYGWVVSQSFLGSLYMEMLQGQKSPLAILQELKPEAQARFDEIFNF